MSREAGRKNDWKITIVKFDSGVDNPPRSGQKQNRLDKSIAVRIMEDLSEVVDDLMDRTPEFPTLLKHTKNTEKPKYRQTGNLLAASMLQALTAETGLKLLYEMDNPQN